VDRHPYCKPCLLDYQRRRRRERLDSANPNRRRWSRDFVRHDYFVVIERPVQAYVAGLLAADGNVLKRQQRVSIELSFQDRELVHLVRDQLAPGFPVRERTRSTGTRTLLVAITSPDLCYDLGQLGITPRKSLTLAWPKTLDPEFQRPFLLGYFDGDGFITWSRTNGRLYPRWGLLGTHEFLSEALDVIVKATAVRPRVIRSFSNARLHSFHINGRDAWTTDRWLHADGELGLARKRLIPPTEVA
jgi:hypothetical protein